MRKYFHVTDVADEILAQGFRDGTGSYGLVDMTLTGVFLSDQALTFQEGAKGEQVLEVCLPDHVELPPEAELREEGKPYREWVVPAEFLNRHASVRRFDPDDVEP